MLDNVEKLIKYISKNHLSSIELDLIYLSNNVSYERSDLYLDFVLTLDNLLETTYFGHDLMDDDSKIKHYNWCWEKTCKLLNTDLIKFNDNDEVYVYFLDTYLESFYDESHDIIHMKDFWLIIFNYISTKSKPEVDTYLRIYKAFEESYKSIEY